ncbi:ImmA/IrrE family metallo-endopeptidase [Candidatus Berkiella cookevillensis]|uniref:Antitoxin HigA n=1 Tax=Candidatus Berkiella cookevillensis TaxID=437022 RepID=A0A0Q9YBP0_9GAMM|nr:ImmA/IrrE family metallo-endopeptidase [Candidatus Berkiella cookevillensis]MCS5707786.1 ImmA/IrrE family metallo-endopeptidase [Candidatus Berkiella cookevillensis]
MLMLPIQNEEQHKTYLKEIELLIENDPMADSPEGERLSLLMIAVKEYEAQHFFFEKPTPIEAIQFRMEEQNLKQNDLIPYIGSKSKVSEILSGKRKLTVPMIRALNEYLKIPAEILIQESNKRINKIEMHDMEFSQFPFKEMLERKWISETKETIKTTPQKVVEHFLQPIGGLAPQSVMWRKSFNIEKEGKSHLYGLIAWSARVILLAAQIKVSDYDHNLITKDFLKEIAKLSQYEQGPLLAIEKLAKHGIKLIFQKHLSKTHLDGGCFLDKEGKPVIGITLRYDRIDYFWHTLLHELAHIYKHLNNNDDIFLDEFDIEDNKDLKEREADLIAKESFIPKTVWKRSDAFNFQTNKSIIELARTLSIHPAIVAGRIRFETKDYNKFTDLVGQGKVRKLIEEYYNE